MQLVKLKGPWIICHVRFGDNDVEHSKENYKGCFDSINNCPLSDIPIPLSGELQRATQRRAVMAGMAGRGSDNFIKWCTHCKHEIPEHLNINVCDICGGEVVEIN